MPIWSRTGWHVPADPPGGSINPLLSTQAPTGVGTTRVESSPVAPPSFARPSSPSVSSPPLAFVSSVPVPSSTARPLKPLATYSRVPDSARSSESGISSMSGSGVLAGR
ncbi:hypothetical protein COSO111634_23465 [Corallococcus soli]